MADDPLWFQPAYRIPAPHRPPGESIWSLRKDTEQLTCELHDCGQAFGVEIRIWRNGEFHSSSRFENRAHAERYATVLRGDFEREGWTVG